MAVKLLKAGDRKPAGYKVQAKGDRGEIYLYDIIGSSWFGGISAKQFSADLKALGSVSTIDVRINSDGGDVFEGRTMYTLLAEHKARVVVHVDGLAASIASLIAMAGNEIRMADGSFMMLHNPWGVTIGDAADHRVRAELLDTIAATMRQTYAVRSKKDEGDVKKWMDAETWFTASEAKDVGLADIVAEPMKAAAAVRDIIAAADGRKVESHTRFKNIPAALRPNRAAALEKIAAMRG